MPDQPADTRTTLLKQILVGIGGAADIGQCPDVWPQILQAIVQVYGEPTGTLADTQQQLLVQWLEGVGISYSGAIQTEVEALTLLYIYYGGADDSTLPDHEIPLLRGILENVSPPAPPSDDTYLRPGGIFTYNRPGGIFIYLRP